MRTSIYFLQFLKDDAESVGGGGIGTLISHLCPLLESMGSRVTVYQCASRPFEAMYGKSKVVGIPLLPGSGRSNEAVVSRFRSLAGADDEAVDHVEIFAADFFSVRNRNPLAIAVQNGLAWDAAIEHLTPKPLHHTALGERIFRMRCQLRGLRRFETCYNRVATDLYFLNWYRSFRGVNLKGRVWYNPNPAPAAAWASRRETLHGSPLRIILARRLVPEKGTRLITEVFRELLQLRPGIELTIAGEGPDRDYLRSAFAGDARVTFIAYRTEEALRVHAEHDIAVVPSVCGEATCLAVLEAMASGCAVIATNMGGTITQIIDGFNGRLCWPTKESVLQALLDVIDSDEQRKRFQRQGWAVSQEAFGLASWRGAWTRIIESVVGGRDEASRLLMRRGP
jgi:glycosyltransferase involved in cell wall biosynthesis